MKRKIARFEITQAGKIGEEFSDDPKDCMLVLEIPTKFIGVLIEELTRARQFVSPNDKADDLLCLLLSGKPHPQEHGRETWLSDEYATTTTTATAAV